MNLDVYLIDANTPYVEDIETHYNQGLFILDLSLRSLGMTPRILPENPVAFSHMVNTKIEGEEIIVNELLPNLTDKSVVGISTWTQRYPFLEEIARSIHDEFPNTYIVGGGPHFTTHQETKDEFLDSPLDAYVVGGSAFTEFCDGLKKDKILLTDGVLFGEMPKGFYTRSNNNVIGSDIGGFPKINLEADNMHIWTQRMRDDKDEYIFVSLPSSNQCPNGCTYCSSPKNGMDVEFLKSYLSSILDSPNLTGRKYIVEFNGNNPFIEENRSNTEDLLSNILNNDAVIDLKFFVDSNLFIGTNYDYLKNMVLNNEQIFNIFVGMDVVQENDSRKLRGVSRTQEQLNFEFEGLANFIYDVDTKKNRTHISPSYVFFPDDDLNTYRQVALDMFYLSLLEKRTKNISLEFHSNILTPFPATKIRETYKNRIDESLSWNDYDVSTNVWKNAPLLDLLDKSLFFGSIARNYSVFDDLNEQAIKIAEVYYPYFITSKSINVTRLSNKKESIIFLDLVKNISDNLTKQSKNHNCFSNSIHAENIKNIREPIKSDLESTINLYKYKLYNLL